MSLTDYSTKMLNNVIVLLEYFDKILCHTIKGLPIMLALCLMLSSTITMKIMPPGPAPAIKLPCTEFKLEN